MRLRLPPKRVAKSRTTSRVSLSEQDDGGGDVWRLSEHRADARDSQTAFEQRYSFGGSNTTASYDLSGGNQQFVIDVCGVTRLW